MVAADVLWCSVVSNLFAKGKDGASVVERIDQQELKRERQSNGSVNGN
jgi:hypothetical protein